MDKQQKELIIAVIVVTIAIIAVFATIKKFTRSRPQRPKSAPAQVIDKDESSKELVYFKTSVKDTAKKEDVYDVKDLDWGRDPFVLDKRSLGGSSDQNWVAKMEQISKLELSGMIISEDNPKDSIAVINEENLKAGDKISGFTIKDIRANFVVLESGGEKFMLRLWEEESEKKENLQGVPQ
ncbi:MAG: general secretion pathway protein GspB [Candidatus Omnitrophica bacterium]|nr:general secretion pathway protein GspB [Candidatus Omnitrophota bacterium]